MSIIRPLAALALGLALATQTASSLTQKHPDRPIKIAHPFSP